MKANGLGSAGIHISGASASILTIHGGVQLFLKEAPQYISPYFVGSLGYFNISGSDIIISSSRGSSTFKVASEGALSFMFGAGFCFDKGEDIEYFVEGRYGFGLTKGEITGYIPFRFGVKIKS